MTDVTPVDTSVTAPAPSSGSSEEVMSSEDTKIEEEPNEMIVDETD